MLPEGWTECRVRDLVRGLEAGTSVNSTDVPPRKGEAGILKTSCVSKGYFDPTKSKLVDDPLEKGRLKSPVRPDTILISRMNTPALVGANAYVSQARDNLYLPDRLWQILPSNRCASVRWLAYWFASNRTRSRLSSLATGTSGSMKNITKGDVLSLPLAVPHPAEQRWIAGALSTWDQAIETVDNLIDNARARKKALMQQLLTGKRRLPGFEGRHVELPLTEVTTVKTGDSNKQDSLDEGPYIFFDRSTEVRRSHQYLFDTEAVIVGGEGQEFVPKYFAGKFDLHQRAYAIQGFNRCFGRYIYHLINHQRHLLRRFAVGSTVPSLRMASFEKIPVPMLEIEEQRAIAEILDSADREVELLCDQKAALQTEKRALMQQLLTGKRRVKVKEMA